MHTHAHSTSRTGPKPAAARSDAAVAPIPSARAAARSSSPAQRHGSHENDVIEVQHFTSNGRFLAHVLVIHVCLLMSMQLNWTCTYLHGQGHVALVHCYVV